MARDDHGLLLATVSVLAPKRGAKLQPDGSYLVLCPGHDDKNPSCHVSVSPPGHKYRLKWHCFAGCPVPRIREAAVPLGVPDEAFAKREKQGNGSSGPTNHRPSRETRYPYHAPTGKLLYTQRRVDYGPGEKKVWTEPKGVTERSLYRLSEVVNREPADRWVILPEGELCVDRLAAEGFVATTNSHGAIDTDAKAARWRDVFVKHLTGARVALLPDNDQPGGRHRDHIAGMLDGYAETIRVVDLPGLPNKGDVVDWFKNGGSADELQRRILEAPEWKRPAVPITNGHDPDGVYLVRASDLKPEHVEYLEAPLLPLRVPTLVTGLDGVGKSTILYAKAALATRGKLNGAFTGHPVDVVVASCEDHPQSVIYPRLVAAGADLDRVHIVKVRRDGISGDIALPDDLDAIAQRTAEVDARLLVIDPLVGHMPIQVDTHKAQHVRSVMAPFAHLAEERRLAVACVVHFNGAASTDIRTRTSGSKALRDASRSVIVCGENPEDDSLYVMVQDKHSFGPKTTTGTAYRIAGSDVEVDGEVYQTSRVVWLGEVDIRASQLLEPRGSDDERNDIDSAVEILQTLVKETGQVEIAEAQKATEGISSKTLQRARRKLGLDYEQEGFGKNARRLWRHPPHGGHGGHAPSGPDGVQRAKPVAAEGKDPSPTVMVDTLVGMSTVGAESTVDAAGENNHGLRVAQARAEEVRRRRGATAMTPDDEPASEPPGGGSV
jgi:putative DNA primase/helicase